ncbi:restriction endonuclease subunit S [Klebsiella michiganensis]|uniref:restriction endonuclease subunit S n=1 Tax=Klebsiella michiganensis TaxID=1134687 RepID=UPI001CCA4BAF|nr:restriction endonuclease subunit S [Klebsiella michiganensis]MBZ7501004.1 restriction endonuclease subunit S [Klebsiella michiganensis]
MSVLSYLEKLLDGVDVKWLSLGSVAVIKTGQSVNKNMISDNPGKYPVINSGRAPLGFIDIWNTDDDPIGITTRGAGVGSITWQDGKYFRGNLNYSVTIKKDCSIKVRYMYHLLLQMQKDIQELCTFDGIPALNASNLKRLQIPIPCPDTPEKSLAIQAEIVRILDKFTALTAELTAELTMRKKQYNYYRDQLLSFYEGEVEWRMLGELGENLDSKRKPITSGLREAGSIPYYGASGIVDYVKDYIFDGDFLLISEDGANLLARNTPIAFSISGKSWVNNHAHVIKFDSYAERRYVEYYLNSIDLAPYISGAAQPKLNKKNLESIRIPNPSPEDKERIVSILDKFDALTNSISEGLPREIELRQKQYEYYRDLLFSFPRPETASN